MNLIELRTFLAIVETGSLVRASARLNVTQSTVTARLKALEDEVGQVLINRQKSGATMTAAGVRLHRYAGTISDLWQQARAETGLPDAVQGVCNMACHPDLWAGLGQRLFDDLRRSHGGLALSVWQGGQADMAAWTGAGLSDMALTFWPTAGAAQQVVDLATDQLVLVATTPDNPTKFDPGYVFVEAGEAFGRDHAAAYADAATARLSFGSAQLGLDHILAEGGSAYLPLRIAAPLIATGRLFRLDAPVFTRKSYVVVNRSALAGWPWFDAAIARIREQSGAL